MIKHKSINCHCPHHMQPANHNQLVQILNKQGNIAIFCCSAIPYTGSVGRLESRQKILSNGHLITLYIHLQRNTLALSVRSRFVLLQNKSWSFLRVYANDAMTFLLLIIRNFWIFVLDLTPGFEQAPAVSFLSLIKCHMVENTYLLKAFMSMLLFSHTPTLTCSAPSGFLNVFVMWLYICLFTFFTVCVFFGVYFNKQTDLYMNNFLKRL